MTATVHESVISNESFVIAKTDLQGMTSGFDLRPCAPLGTCMDT